MAKLSKGSTINGEKIIHRDNANDHSHYLVDIQDFGTIARKDIGENGGIYAERIHDFTLNDLYDRYLHNDNNEMQGFLKINNFNDDKSLINKQYLDQYADELLLDSSLNTIESSNEISIVRNPETMVATNAFGYIDRTRLDIDNIENEFRPAINGPLEVQVASVYIYTITNFNSFSNYDISLSDGGSVVVNNEQIRLETDNTNSQDRYITLTIVLDGTNYNYNIYFLQG